MKLAIISDLHSNLEALEAVLRDIDTKKADGIVCLGDLVNYGPNPIEVLDTLEQCKPKHVLTGNHDASFTNEFRHLAQDSFNSVANASAEWTKEKLRKRDIQMMERLHYQVRLDRTVFAHGIPVHNGDGASARERKLIGITTYTNDIADINQGLRSMASMNAAYGFVGHLHIPGIFVDDEGFPIVINKARHERYVCKADEVHLINVGSVGQPRDGDNKACYAFAEFYSDHCIVTICRVEYDFTQTQRKIIEAGLPELLATRLEVGR